MGVGGGGRRHGDQEGREGEIILMILSNVPYFLGGIEISK